MYEELTARNTIRTNCVSVYVSFNLSTTIGLVTHIVGTSNEKRGQRYMTSFKFTHGSFEMSQTIYLRHLRRKTLYYY